MKINELDEGSRRVDLEATVIEKTDAREVRSRYTDEPFIIAEATIKDETGTVVLTLWNEQIEQVNVGDKVSIGNGYVKSYNGKLQLSSGKYGTLTVL